MPTLDRQIEAVEREIAMRKTVYPRMTARGSLAPDKAEQQILDMMAVKHTLELAGSMSQLLAELLELLQAMGMEPPEPHVGTIRKMARALKRTPQ